MKWNETYHTWHRFKADVADIQPNHVLFGLVGGSSGAWKKTKHNKQKTDKVQILTESQQIQNNHTLCAKQHNCRMKVCQRAKTTVRTFCAWFHLSATVLGLCVHCALLYLSHRRAWDEMRGTHTLVICTPVQPQQPEESRRRVKTMILKSRIFFKVVQFCSTDDLSLYTNSLWQESGLCLCS